MGQLSHTMAGKLLQTLAKRAPMQMARGKGMGGYNNPHLSGYPKNTGYLPSATLCRLAPLSAASSSAASPWLSRLSRGSCPSKYTRLGGCRILARLRLEEAYNHEGVRAGRDVISAEGVLLGITHGPGGPDTEAIGACGFGRRDHVAIITKGNV